jgi:hypothetical protein
VSTPRLLRYRPAAIVQMAALIKNGASPHDIAAIQHHFVYMNVFNSAQDLHDNTGQ